MKSNLAFCIDGVGFLWQIIFQIHVFTNIWGSTFSYEEGLRAECVQRASELSLLWCTFWNCISKGHIGSCSKVILSLGPFCVFCLVQLAEFFIFFLVFLHSDKSIFSLMVWFGRALFNPTLWECDTCKKLPQHWA